MIRLYGGFDFRDAGDGPERSLLLNSLAAQEIGSDYTDPYHVSVLGAGLTRVLGATRWSIDVAREAHAALTVHAAPAAGSFSPPLAAAETRWASAGSAPRARATGAAGTATSISAGAARTTRSSCRATRPWSAA